jgi:hypothetical protein
MIDICPTCHGSGFTYDWDGHMDMCPSCGWLGYTPTRTTMSTEDDPRDLQDLVIPGGIVPSDRVRLALTQLAQDIEQDHHTVNGTTALYWALLYTIQQHVRFPRSRSEEDQP